MLDAALRRFKKDPVGSHRTCVHHATDQLVKCPCSTKFSRAVDFFDQPIEKEGRMWAKVRQQERPAGSSTAVTEI